MCGIIAVVKRAAVPCTAGTVESMRDEAAHRGPDDAGVELFGGEDLARRSVAPDDRSWLVALGHRRLSILDVSPSGHQPMAYRDRYWVVFNGELYNFVEIRQELERRGHEFRSRSDTEVLLAAYAEWGTGAFRRFRGMWGLVILDRQRREVIACRDRMGIKPLYLHEGPDLVALVSEIKQLRHLPGYRNHLDEQAAHEYLTTGYEDQRRSLFRGVVPLGPGTYRTFHLDDHRWDPETSFWAPEGVQATLASPVEAGVLLAEKLRESVRLHLRSDVPVGCALSGGLDSSTIAVLMHEAREPGGSRLHSFTASFPGESIDERSFVEVVAAQVDSIQHYVTPTPETFLDDLDRFLYIHDEPVGSLSQYAGYCVARTTRAAGVPVILNGQGGDEILEGYWQTYFLHLWRQMRALRLWSVAGHFAGAVCGQGNPDLIGQVPPCGGASGRGAAPGPGSGSEATAKLRRRA